jgi:hypothetical protein
MSTHFNVYCNLCEVKGPQIRRSPSGTKLLTIKGGQFGGGEAAANDWARFLIEHEYHELVLKHE